MPKHISQTGGICVAVRRHATKETVSLITKDRLQPGKQLRNVCVHHIGGSGPATLTAARKKAVLRAHRAHRPGKNGKCSQHQRNWKALCSAGAV